MSKLTESTLVSVTYTKESSGDVSTRMIVPVSVPHDNIRAIDVSDIAEADQQGMATLVSEYKEYVAGVMASTYNFEDWVSHVKGTEIKPKWRSFKPSNIQLNS